MIKVAVVGTNGLAQYIANGIATQTSHQFVVLSRRVSHLILLRMMPATALLGSRSPFKAKWSLDTLITHSVTEQADYSNPADLRFKLAGVDTVISTISGNAQLALIDAAAAAHVRRFVPSEFGGPPSLRPQNDLLDHHRRAAILRLHQHESSGMRFTVFTCGVLYERFAPGGMAASQIGLASNIGQEGDYLMDFRRRRAQVPYLNAAGQPATICMTSAADVARFVVVALDLPSWPREFRLRGERLTVREVVAIAEDIQGMLPSNSSTDQKTDSRTDAGRAFEISGHTRSSLQDALTYARAVGDRARETRVHHLITTAEGRYDFVNTNLNQLVSVRPESFRDWLLRVWSPVT
ncbi:NmrA-like family protein [Cladophialophora carrionii]|uniref:NmrA-like family protein n=1 Tax=Cladophialophora carrionii TaxID=86049 RepID=A0A1C1CI13_9EURO|nr:NmrA-like family protein [Cladophialophora carrionii]